MEIVNRKACRALILTPSHEVLLIKIENPDGNWFGWITPGGGIDPGEDEITALKRELLEELGLKDFEVGPKIWTRFHAFPWKEKQIEQHEVFFLVSVDRFEPRPTLNPDVVELLDLKEFRWWTLDEIMASSEVFSPRRFQALLKELVVNGAPAEVLDVGI